MESTIGLETASRLEAEGRLSEAIDVLTVQNRQRPDAEVERRLARLRYAAFAQLDRHPRPDQQPAPEESYNAEPSPGLPEVGPEEVTRDGLRRSVHEHGCLLVRGLVSLSEAERLADGIDKALDASPGGPGAKQGRPSPWYHRLPVSPEEQWGLRRGWVDAGGGRLTADSPRMLFTLLELFEAIGLREAVTGFLGERPVMSANKCTLRKVPVDSNAGWHQDGAFLGSGIRALNIWLSLSHCGQDAPGLDVLPRRLPYIVETGTGGSHFDWAVGPEVVDELARDTPVARPVFAPGDALIFDDMFLHQTGVREGMTRPRYAIETWFFAPSAYPEGHVPVVW